MFSSSAMYFFFIIISMFVCKFYNLSLVLVRWDSFSLSSKFVCKLFILSLVVVWSAYFSTLSRFVCIFSSLFISCMLCFFFSTSLSFLSIFYLFIFSFIVVKEMVKMWENLDNVEKEAKWLAAKSSAFFFFFRWHHQDFLAFWPFVLLQKYYCPFFSISQEWWIYHCISLILNHFASSHLH